MQIDLGRLEKWVNRNIREDAKSCTWRKITLYVTTGCGLMSWKEALTKKPLEGLEDEETMSQHHAFTAEANSLLVCIRKSVASSQGDFIFLCSALMRDTWSTVHSPEFFSTSET